MRAVARSGAALIMALLVIIILDCVLIGALHLATIEQQLARNGDHALRLRLAAESAARLAALGWTPTLDSLTIGAIGQGVAGTTPDGIDYEADVERLQPGLFIIRSRARQPPPLSGSAVAALLVTPPLLPPGFMDAPAALTGARHVYVTAGGALAARATCTAADTVALRLSDAGMLSVTAGSIEGAVAVDGGSTLQQTLARLLAGAVSDSARGLLVAATDTVIDHDLDGVLIAAAGVRFTSGTTFHGLLLAAGSVTVDAGATIRGASHVGMETHLAGSIILDSCTALAALGVSRLLRVSPARPRAWIPAF